MPWWGAPAGHAVGTSYSLAGRVTGESDSAGPGLSYSFDTAGRATAELQLTNGTSRTVTWTLDAMGNHTRLSWPDAYAVDYTFDALNRMSTVAVHSTGANLATYAYDPLSRRTAVTYNGGTSSMGYSWSNAGDLLTLTNTLAGSASVTFTDTYTAAHQLQSETTSNDDYVWTPPPPTGHDSYAAVNALNQYPAVNGGAVSWDANGNLGAISGATYTHDAENRLLAARTATAASYLYDPLNRRVARTIATTGSGPLWGTAVWGAFTWTAAPATTTTFLHDGDNEIAEYDNSGSLIRRFVPGAAIDEPLAMITSAGAATFFHTDRKGSVIAMADTSGARVEGPYTYDPYGNCFVGATTTSCTTLAATTEPLRYTGQRYDAETGLYYYRARYYGPGIGRFYETDPAGYKPDVNWYSYVGNDPTDRTDPTGDQAIPIVPLIAPPPPIPGQQGQPTTAQVIEHILNKAQEAAANAPAPPNGPIPSPFVSNSEIAGTPPPAAMSDGTKETGSYTNTHASGRTYSGKGDRARSQASGRRVEKETGDPHVATDWTRSGSDRDAFKDEAGRIEENGGKSSEENYNKIDSPERKCVMNKKYNDR